MSVELLPSKRLWSIRELADVFDTSANNVTNKTRNIPYIEKVGTSRKWRLNDVAYALCKKPEDHFDGKNPDELSPTDRDKWYSSEQRRIKLLTEAKTLLVAAEVEQFIAEMFKALHQSIATLPDVLERDAGLTPEQVQSAISVVDRTLLSASKAVSEVATDG